MVQIMKTAENANSSIMTESRQELEGVGEGQNEEIIRGPEEALRVKNMFVLFIVTTSPVCASGKA